MLLALIGVLAVLAIVGVSMLSPRIKVAAPLILAVLGLGVSFLPNVPPIHVPSQVILAVVLPPLLYASSIRLPLANLRQNAGSISALAVILVILSAFGTGFLLFTLFPDLNLAAAVALGAVISPTDAVAATSIGKRLGLPPRLLAVLEGESLVNDASALVLLRTAIAATAGAISIWQVFGVFAYSAVAGVAIGVAIGFLTVAVRARVSDPILTTAISFVVPFLAYLPAELAGASGVLSVVAAGLITGHLGAKSFSAPARISEQLNWSTFQFLLENGVFLLMGLELKTILGNVAEHHLSVSQAVFFGLLATAVLIAVRFGVVFAMTAVTRRRRARAPNGPPPGTWGGAVVLSWSGMRGVVTVAAAQSLPEGLPYREQLVLIAYTVAIVTLLLQGASLPAVIKGARIRGTDGRAEREEFAELMDHIRVAGEEYLDSPELSIDGVPPDPLVVERARNDSLARSESAWEVTRKVEGAPTPHREYSVLRREVLRTERAALIAARNRAAFSAETLARAQETLDLEEARLEQAGGLDS
jgi:Na+/H+ antiporter